MAQKPLGQMSERGYEHMSEEAGYVLDMLKSLSKYIEDQKASKEELKLIAGSLESVASSSAPRAEFLQALKYMEGKVDKQELIKVVDMMVDVEDKKEILDAISVIDDKLDTLVAGITALCVKLDDATVTDLPDDFEAEIVPQLI